MSATNGSMTRRPAHYTALQGSASATFVPPPLDGTFYVPEMIDWHLERSASHPYAELVGAEGEENVEISWGEFARAVHRLGADLSTSVGNRPSGEGKPQTVAILAKLDNFTYCTLVAALLRAGFEPFPLAPELSIEAVHHLLERTGATALIGSGPQSGEESSALGSVIKDVLLKMPAVTLVSPPNAGDLYPRLFGTAGDAYDADKDAQSTILLPSVRSLPSYQNHNERWPCMIGHSSGSTGLPKPIRIHHKAMMTWVTAPWYGDVDLCGAGWGAVHLAMAHSSGMTSCLSLPIGCGTVPVMFNPSFSAPTITPASILDALKRTRTRILSSAPVLCEVWAKDQQAMNYLASLDAVLFAGSPLRPETGDLLTANGVCLVSVFGSTEAGPVFKLLPSLSTEPRDWKYSELCPNLDIAFEHEEDNLYRCIILENETRVFPDMGRPYSRAFDTQDQLEEHPTTKGLWRFVRRVDDVIILSIGMKSDPKRLEDLILRIPGVSAVIVFGQGRPNLGILVEPAPEVDASSQGQEDFRRRVWDAIQSANSSAIHYERVPQDFILVADNAKKPFVRTAKGTVAGKATLNLYADEIVALYTAAA